MKEATEKIKLAYILAASHSGSTLLAFLLGAHPEIQTVGELKLTSIGDPNDYRCSCREYIKACPFWNKIKACMAEKGFEFDFGDAGTDIRTKASPYVKRLLKPLHRGKWLECIRDLGLIMSPNWRSNFPLIQKRNMALIECISQLSRKKIIVDSSKIGIRLKYLNRMKNIDLRVVRLIRDGRGVALTYVDPERFADAKDPSLRRGGDGKSRLSKKLSMEKAVMEWRRSNEEAEYVMSNIERDHCIEIHYEDLCSRTEETLRTVLRFLGTRSNMPVLDFKGMAHHVVGNGMRMDSTNEIILDDRWKNQLTMDDLDTFNQIGGKLNKRLGYE
jgi:hypothetical protein